MKQDHHPEQTAKSFEYKWTEHPNCAFKTTLDPSSDIHQWIMRRNGWRGLSDLQSRLSTKSRILDAGCGNGRVTALLTLSAPDSAEIVGADLVSHEIALQNLKEYSNVHIVQHDLLSSPKNLGLFDFVYCQEVLHHTANPKGAFLNLASTLRDSASEIAIYVYKKKAPVREYVDDFLRQKFASLSNDEVMRHSIQLADLGRVLASLKVEFNAPDVSCLGIKSGRYDIQRFFYHFFTKCFWNPELSAEENAVINFDWYSPLLCSRHETSEVREWFNSANLSITHEFEDEYGITMHGRPSSV
jgi:SAM-dependent methyltransferase